MYERVSSHVVAQEFEFVGEVPARDHPAAARARARHLVAQVPRVRVADVRPLAPRVRHCNGPARSASAHGATLWCLGPSRLLLTAPAHLVGHLLPERLHLCVEAGHRHVVSRVQESARTHQRDQTPVVRLARIYKPPHLRLPHCSRRLSFVTLRHA